MNVTFIWFDECANYRSARRLLQEVMEERGVKDGVEGSTPHVSGRRAMPVSGQPDDQNRWRRH